ncbi:hypothetical protein D3C87_963560 [compost metagenome]
MPSMVTIRAPGTWRATSFPHSIGTSGSTSPWITSVGAFSDASRSLRLPDAMMAASWRA